MCLSFINILPCIIRIGGTFALSHAVVMMERCGSSHGSVRISASPLWLLGPLELRQSGVVVVSHLPALPTRGRSTKHRHAAY